MGERVWINSPSKFSPLNKYNGVNFISMMDGDDYRLYFLSGPVISMRVPKSLSRFLSKGWK
jgi:hypothetical protein